MKTAMFGLIFLLSIIEANLQYEVTQLQQEVEFLKHVSVEQQQSLDDLQSWRNFTALKTDKLHEEDDTKRTDSIGKYDDIQTNNLNGDFEICSRKLNVLSQRVEYISRGASNEKHAVREVIESIRTAVSDDVALMTKRIKSAGKRLNRVRTALSDDVEFMTKQIDSIEKTLNDVRGRSGDLKTFRTLTAATLTDVRKDVEGNAADIKRLHKDLDECKKQVQTAQVVHNQFVIKSEIVVLKDEMNKILEEIRILKHIQDGWVIFRGFTYKLFTSKQTFNVAVETCKSNDAWLVDVQNSEENLFLDRRFGKDYFWVGVSDQKREGIWTLVSGAVLPYTNWAVGEPNDYKGREDCARTGADLGWNWMDVSCSYTYNFVCKKNN